MPTRACSLRRCYANCSKKFTNACTRLPQVSIIVCLVHNHATGVYTAMMKLLSRCT
jgi:hypothetical protein